jgi:AcrR family transcriptional regulator
MPEPGAAGRSRKARATPRAHLSREAVLDAAVQLADEDGLDAVTMRRLARALGSEAMSIYYHVPGKDDLLVAMADRVVDEMEPARPSPDWRASVTAAMVSRRTVLQRHPWAADLLMSAARLTPARTRQMEALLATLQAAGFEGDLADHAYHAIDITVWGFALWEARFDAALRHAPPDIAETTLAGVSATEWPATRAHLEFHLRPADGHRVPTFDLVLGLLLDGLERLRLDAQGAVHG